MTSTGINTGIPTSSFGNPDGPCQQYPASNCAAGVNAIMLDPALEYRRINFLHHVGDYAGRLHNCLKKASEACGSCLLLRVADLETKLPLEDREGDQHTTRAI